MTTQSYPGVDGTKADAAVTSDAAGTHSSKLRGLIKWAYERMPASLGQKVMAQSLPVAIASDQSLSVDISNTATVNVGNTPDVTISETIAVNLLAQPGIADVNNSFTATSLADSAWQHGTWTDVKDLASCRVDVRGTGQWEVSVEWSDDSSHVAASSAVINSTLFIAGYLFNHKARYVRVSVQNQSGAAQTIVVATLNQPASTQELLPTSSVVSLGDGVSGANTRAPYDPFWSLGPVYTPTLPYVFDGSNWQRKRGDATNGAYVQVKTSNTDKAEDAASGSGDTGTPILAVRRDTPAAETSTDGDYTIPTADSTGAQRVTGRYAEDAASAGGEYGFPQLLVRRDTPAAETSTDGDFTQPTADSVGAQYVHSRSGVLEGRTVKTAFVDNTNTNGDVTVVSAVTSKKIRVISYSLYMGGTATTLFFRTAASGTQISMSHRMSANTNFVHPGNVSGFVFETASGQALVINASAGNSYSAQVQYIEV